MAKTKTMAAMSPMTPAPMANMIQSSRGRRFGTTINMPPSLGGANGDGGGSSGTNSRSDGNCGGGACGSTQRRGAA